jgi:molybdopterin molybdotransferase
MAMCKHLGINPEYKGVLKDDLGFIKSSLNNALNNDIVLISGGVSMGDYDFVKEALISIGANIIFHRVSIKPGKPFLFAKKGKTLFFGLPGNPVSTMVEFFLFVKPVIHKMMGAKDIFNLSIPAEFEGNYKKKNDRAHYIYVKLYKKDGKLIAKHIPSHGSADVPSFVFADGIVEIEKEKNIVKTGERVEVKLIGEVLTDKFYN